MTMTRQVAGVMCGRERHHFVSSLTAAERKGTKD